MSLYLYVKMVIKPILVIIERSYQLHTFFSNVLVSRLSLYIDKITGDHQCGFRRNRSTADQIFCIRQILEKNGSITGQYLSYL
jgi:hypothetical protein